MDYLTLNHKVILYVPSTIYDGEVTPEEFSNRTNYIADTFTGLFGGASIESVRGFYKSKEGAYITEAINKVVSYCDDKQLGNNLEIVLNLAVQCRDDWSQESIGVEIDNRFLLI